MQHLVWRRTKERWYSITSCGIFLVSWTFDLENKTAAVMDDCPAGIVGRHRIFCITCKKTMCYLCKLPPSHDYILSARLVLCAMLVFPALKTKELIPQGAFQEILNLQIGCSFWYIIETLSLQPNQKRRTMPCIAEMHHLQRGHQDFDTQTTRKSRIPIEKDVSSSHNVWKKVWRLYVDLECLLSGHVLILPSVKQFFFLEKCMGRFLSHGDLEMNNK